MTLVGHVHRMKLLIDNEIKRVRNHWHLLLVILHIIVFGLLQKNFHSRFAEELDKRRILRKALVSTEQQLSSLVFVAGGDSLLGIVQYLIDKTALSLIEFFHVGAEFHILAVVFSLCHRARYNQRGSCIIDQNGVDLIDNSIMMFALHQIIGVDGHIVAQIIETELVVGTESDITFICPASCIGIGLMLVNAIHAESVEHVERAHPLGVTLGEVVVYRNHMHPFPGKGIEEHRQCCHKRLAFTGRHFSNLAFMKGYTANKLHVIMHHVPCYLVASGNPFVMVDGLVTVDGHKIMRCRKITVKIIGFHNDF